MIAFRSALRSTIAGATPPCSSAERVPGASFECSDQPTRAEPMKLRNATRGSVASRSAKSLLVGMKVWHQGSGRPASCTKATKSRHDNGVVEAGLTITGQPTAIAGTT